MPRERARRTRRGAYLPISRTSLTHRSGQNARTQRAVSLSQAATSFVCGRAAGIRVPERAIGVHGPVRLSATHSHAEARSRSRYGASLIGTTVVGVPGRPTGYWDTFCPGLRLESHRDGEHVAPSRSPAPLGTEGPPSRTRRVGGSTQCTRFDDSASRCSCVSSSAPDVRRRIRAGLRRRAPRCRALQRQAGPGSRGSRLARVRLVTNADSVLSFELRFTTSVARGDDLLHVDGPGGAWKCDARTRRRRRCTPSAGRRPPRPLSTYRGLSVTTHDRALAASETRHGHHQTRCRLISLR